MIIKIELSFYYITDVFYCVHFSRCKLNTLLSMHKHSLCISSNFKLTKYFQSLLLNIINATKIIFEAHWHDERYKYELTPLS